MPMVHVFTPNDCKRIDEKVEVIRKSRNQNLFAPSRNSLALILQFAAAYHVEKGLSLNSLSGMILN